MAIGKTEAAENIENKRLAPYAPSWVDRITQAVDNLKIPFLLFYFFVWVVFLLVLIFLRWNDHIHPLGVIDPPDIVMSGTGLFFLALIHYLDEWAVRKLRIFRQAIKLSEEEFEGLYYQLSTLPARPTLIVSLIMLTIGAVTYLLVPASYLFLNINLASLSSTLQLVNFLFSWFTFGALCFHAFHQLRLGSVATANYLQINLFDLDPIYTFAGLTLRTAFGWLIVAYAWALTTPNLLGNPVIIATILFMQMVAILTFLLPLLRAHDRIMDKKNEILHEIGTRMENAVAEMSRINDDYDKEKIAKLGEMLSALTLAEERIRKIPVWPWRPGVFNSLATAILLPNALWLVQTFMGQFLPR